MRVSYDKEKEKLVTIHPAKNRFCLVLWVLRIIHIYGFVSAFDEGGTALDEL